MMDFSSDNPWIDRGLLRRFRRTADAPPAGPPAAELGKAVNNELAEAGVPTLKELKDLRNIIWTLVVDACKQTSLAEVTKHHTAGTDPKITLADIKAKGGTGLEPFLKALNGQILQKVTSNPQHGVEIKEYDQKVQAFLQSAKKAEFEKYEKTVQEIINSVFKAILDHPEQYLSELEPYLPGAGDQPDPGVAKTFVDLYSRGFRNFLYSDLYALLYYALKWVSENKYEKSSKWDRIFEDADKYKKKAGALSVEAGVGDWLDRVFNPQDKEQEDPGPEINNGWPSEGEYAVPEFIADALGPAEGYINIQKAGEKTQPIMNLKALQTKAYQIAAKPELQDYLGFIYDPPNGMGIGAKAFTWAHSKIKETYGGEVTDAEVGNTLKYLTGVALPEGVHVPKNALAGFPKLQPNTQKFLNAIVKGGGAKAQSGSTTATPPAGGGEASSPAAGGESKGEAAPGTAPVEAPARDPQKAAELRAEYPRFVTLYRQVTGEKKVPWTEDAFGKYAETYGVPYANAVTSQVVNTAKKYRDISKLPPPAAPNPAAPNPAAANPAAPTASIWRRVLMNRNADWTTKDTKLPSSKEMKGPKLEWGPESRDTRFEMGTSTSPYEEGFPAEVNDKRKKDLGKSIGFEENLKLGDTVILDSCKSDMGMFKDEKEKYPVEATVTEVFKNTATLRTADGRVFVAEGENYEEPSEYAQTFGQENEAMVKDLAKSKVRLFTLLLQLKHSVPQNLIPLVEESLAQLENIGSKAEAKEYQYYQMASKRQGFSARPEVLEQVQEALDRAEIAMEEAEYELGQDKSEANSEKFWKAKNNYKRIKEHLLELQTGKRKYRPMVASNRFAKGSFEEWMKAVDAACQEKCGMSIHDLADCPFADWYEEGVRPASAAAKAIRMDRYGSKNQSAWIDPKVSQKKVKADALPEGTHSVNVLDQMMAYEQGELSEDETIELFQNLLDSGLVWKLQGHYGRTAKALLDAGLIF